MAQRVVTSLVDDLDEEQTADETVHFALDGVTYEIDLTGDHAADLREVFEPYKSAGRRTGGRLRTAAAAGPGPAETVTATVPAKKTRRRKAKA